MGAKELLSQWASFVENIIGYKPNVRQHKGIYIVSLTGTKAISMVDHLYSDSDIVLDRKFLASCNIRDFAFDKQNMVGQGLSKPNTLVETDGCVSH